MKGKEVEKIGGGRNRERGKGKEEGRKGVREEEIKTESLMY